MQITPIVDYDFIYDAIIERSISIMFAGIIAKVSNLLYTYIQFICYTPAIAHCALLGMI